MEEKELQQDIDLIRRGYTCFVDKVKKLAEEYPKYKSELNEAIRTGKEKELQQDISQIKKGDSRLIKRAKRLAKKFFEYGSELKKAIRTGKEKTN